MEITLRPSGAVVAALAMIVLGLQAVSECGAQPASSPYISPAWSITISNQTQGGSVSLAVQVDLPDSCHYVGDWGQPMLVGNTAYVNTQFWAITNMMCFPIVITVSTNYSLGTLPPGNYNFYLLAWGMAVKAEAFSVSEPGPPRLSILRLNSSQVRLSWLSNATNYSLEFAPSLPAPEWITVTNRPVVIGDEFALTIDLATGQSFYRLHKL